MTIIWDAVSHWARSMQACDKAIIPGALELLTDFKDPLAAFFFPTSRSIRKNSDSIKEYYPSRGWTALARQRSRNSDEGADRRWLWQPKTEYQPRWQVINVEQRILNQKWACDKLLSTSSLCSDIKLRVVNSEFYLFEKLWKPQSWIYIRPITEFWFAGMNSGYWTGGPALLKSGCFVDVILI